MQITNDQRRAQFDSLSEQLKDMYTSDNTTRMIKAFSEEFKIEKRPEFTETIGDIILGFYKIAELPRLLQFNVGLSAEVSKRLASEMIEFLSPLIEHEAAEARTKKDSIASLADKIAAIKPIGAPATTPVDTATTPAGTVPPSEFEPVKPMRTMQTDIDDKKPVHGYGALQATTPETHDDEPVIKATSFDDLRLKP